MAHGYAFLGIPAILARAALNCNGGTLSSFCHTAVTELLYPLSKI
jgi:hypothetical protein